jgi:inorganic pyrophosphatase
MRGSRNPPARQGADPQSEHAMGLDLVPTGNNPPDEINVIIEIPKDAEPVKYEVDKASGAIFVDRILSTPMRYPCNYGYVPHTVCGDGDPADVLVILPLPLIPGSVIRCRPVGVLKMSDEAGGDEKILAVPIDKVFAGYSHIDDIAKVSPHWLERIGHFFEHYKDLEKGKWVKLDGWGGVVEAKTILGEAMHRYNATPDKPNF